MLTGGRFFATPGDCRSRRLTVSCRVSGPTLGPHFLDYCIATVPWRDYAIVGSRRPWNRETSRRCRSLGGSRCFTRTSRSCSGAPNWEGEMGHELHAQFTFVDYVCSGEAENSLVRLVRHVMSGPAAMTRLQHWPRLPRGTMAGSVSTGYSGRDTVPLSGFQRLLPRSRAKHRVRLHRAEVVIRDIARLLVGGEGTLSILQFER